MTRMTFVFPSDADRAENQELDRVCDYLEAMLDKNKELYQEISRLQDIRSNLEDEIDAYHELTRKCDNDERCIWYWHGNGDDNLDSMISSLPIVIRAGQLRKLIASVSVPGLPQRDPNLPAEEQGLFNKFLVRRVDGQDQPGCKHYRCRYFVLDVDHDKWAPAALGAYAIACREEAPKLAQDLAEKWGAQVPYYFGVDYAEQQETTEEDEGQQKRQEARDSGRGNGA